MLLKKKNALIMLHNLASFTVGDRYADNQSKKVVDAPQVAAYFPDVEGVTLLSPAFASPTTIPNATWVNATSGPTPQDTLESFLKDLSRRNKWITYNESPKLVTEEGRSLPYLKLSSGTQVGKKLRIWLQGGIHGDEPAGDQGILALLGKFANNANWTAKVLGKADFLILPRYNADGVAYFQRALASNYDGNRDHAVFERQQTRDIKRLQSEFDPHIFLDAHEYTGVSPVNQKYIRAQDLLLAANKNRNVNTDIRALNEEFVRDVFATVDAYGLRHDAYFTTSVKNGTIVLQEPDSNAAANHKSAGLWQTVTFLAETRGIRLADQHFQRRVATHLIVAETIINKAVNEFDRIYEIIEAGRKAFVDSKEDIVVVQQSSTTSRDVTFIDAQSGDLISVPVQSQNHNPPQIVLKRARPAAYIFSRAWADVAERLRILGVTVDALEEDLVGTVEALQIETAELVATKYEGIVATTVTTSTHQRDVRIPAGGFKVSTRQKNAGYAFALLEPENENSLAHYNKVSVEAGDEWPIYRIL